MELLTCSVEGNQTSLLENKQNFNIFEETVQSQNNSKLIDINLQNNQGEASIANIEMQMNHQHRKSQPKNLKYKFTSPYDADYQNISNPQNINFSKEKSQRKDRLNKFYSNQNLKIRDEYLSNNDKNIQKLFNKNYEESKSKNTTRPANTLEALNLNRPNANKDTDLVSKKPQKSEVITIHNSNTQMTPNKSQIKANLKTEGVSIPSLRSQSVQRNQVAQSLEMPQPAGKQPDNRNNTRNSKFDYNDGVNKTSEYLRFNKAGKLHKDLNQLSKRLKEIKENTGAKNEDSYNYNGDNSQNDIGVGFYGGVFNNQGSISITELKLNNMSKVKRMNEQALNKLWII